MTGSGTIGDPYIIYNVTDLQAMQADPTAYYYYELANDIDASATSGWNGGLGFDPIGTSVSPFSGQFDGKGYTISGLFINRPTEDYTGLFGDVVGSVIKNVGLSGGSITGQQYTGALIGEIAENQTNPPPYVGFSVISCWFR